MSRLKTRYGKFSGMGKGTIRHLRTDVADDVFAKLVKTAAVDTAKDILKACGVCCFSARNDSLLMWSHYADGGAGYCLEFCTAKPPFKHAIEVGYSDAIPELDVVPMLLGKTPSERGAQLFNYIRTKSKDWEYEREWRLIDLYRSGTLPYPAASVKAVYLGPKISAADRTLVERAIDDRGCTAEIWKASPSKSRFAFEMTRLR